VQDDSLASNPLGFTVLPKLEPVILVAAEVEARQLWMAALQATADHVQAAERLREEREAEERRVAAEAEERRRAAEAEERRQKEQREAEERRLAAEAEERRRVAELPLRAELQPLTVLELRARAERDGCTEAAVEDTKLSEQPKVALIGLIVDLHWVVTEAAAAAAAAEAAAAAAEAAAEAAISDARQAWAQKLEHMSSVLTEHYQEMEMRALVPEIKANPLVDDAAVEAALTEETPKPRLVQLLVDAAAPGTPGTLLAEAATAAGKLWCFPFQ
jgi:hypothetical protein